MAESTDPVGTGLVASLARPGGNLTGVTTLTAEVGPKRVELMHELMPAATSIALLVNPAAVAIRETISTDLQTAARKLGLHVYVLHASTERDFDTVQSRLITGAVRRSRWRGTCLTITASRWPWSGRPGCISFDESLRPRAGTRKRPSRYVPNRDFRCL